jgi:hypothetical protein
MSLSVCGVSAQLWPTPTKEAHPFTRWWWLGSAVDSANLAYNLDLYSKAGLGGLEITPIYGVQGNDAHDIPFLSPLWMNMLAYTEQLGKAKNLEIDMNTGTGWPFGGPKVSLNDAACKVLFQTYTLTGRKKVELDVSVSDPKQASCAYLSRLMAYRMTDGAPIAATLRTAQDCVDLTALVDANHQLHWRAPRGEWFVVGLYVGRTLQKVKRAAPGGEGFVIDHFDRGAVTRYLGNISDAFKQSGTACPHTFFNDSYEVYRADWTPTLLEEFAKRRGYDLARYLPEFMDTTANDVSRRIMSDYRETLSDMLRDNFTMEWTDWAHQQGSITRNQAHGSPANLIDLYAAVDIPEIEGFGLSNFGIPGLRKDSLSRPNFSDISMLKYASSAAHITGKKYTSSETFTWLTEHFRTSLSQCKPDLDLMFVGGVNHIVFHGTPYSPKEAKWPGWQFYASINMSPNNSIWHDAPSFFQYITRCQSYLQSGQSDNDCLAYLPVYDMWYEQPGRLLQFDIHSMSRRAPKFISAVHSIMSSGMDVDYISDRYLLSTVCRNGILQTVGGARYKALIMPNVERVSLPVMTHILSLAKEGATVIFLNNMPCDVPGFGNYIQHKTAMDSLVASVKNGLQLNSKDGVSDETISYGRGRLVVARSGIVSPEVANVRSEEMRTRYGLSYIRRKDAAGYFYFISSLQSSQVDAWIPLSVKIASAVLLDPMTGQYGKAQVRQISDASEVYLQLRPGESVLLRTYATAGSDTVPAWKYIIPSLRVDTLSEGWRLHFTESNPKIEGTFILNKPCSWTEIDKNCRMRTSAKSPYVATADSVIKALRSTMATGVYETDFMLPYKAADEWLLDLGDVRESARVRINGQYVGCVWSVPYMLRVGKYLHKGRNHLEVEVTNLAANRISEMDRQGEKWRIFKEINVVDLNYGKGDYSSWAPMPSGLNSAVCLIPCRTLSFK